MALNLFHSNLLEALLEVLNQNLQHAQTHPLIGFKVITSSPGMAHWVKLQLAQKNGIVANIDFPLPVKTVLDVLNILYPDTGAKLSPDSLQWLVLSVLNKQDVLQLPSINRYVASEPHLSKWRQYQLAVQLGSLFDQYMTYRPDWLALWKNNKFVPALFSHSDNTWQQAIWHHVKTMCMELGVAKTRDEKISLFLEQPLTAGQIAQLKTLYPNGVGLFGLSALPPLYLKFFYALSQYIDVSLYLLNPSPHYWADTVDEKYKAKINMYWQRSGRGPIDAYYGVGNPLLSSWGTQGKQFQRLLYDMLPEDGAGVVEDHTFYIEPSAATLLSYVQADMYHLLPSETVEAETVVLNADDQSLQVHSCHSRMREVQVLFDYLLDAFNDKNSTLAPKDVVVLTPNIEDYSHYITAIFGMGYEKGSLKFPYSISDRKPVDSVPEFQAIMLLLRFDDFNFDYQVILQLLNVQTISNAFGFDVHDIQEISGWINSAAIRRGMNASDKIVKENTWHIGLKRLLIGALIGSDQRYDEDSLTLSVALGKQSEKLGQLCELIDRLSVWSKVLTVDKTLSDWIDVTYTLFSQFFAQDEPNANIERLRALLVDKKQALILSEHEKALLGFREYADYIQRLLAENQWGQRFLVGAVNFCSMVPMRSIPFKIVCMLGMNDKQFPRQQFPPSFDLMAKDVQLGDYQKKAEDKTIFLESILSARERLFISYLGRSNQDNSLKEPSVLLSELVEYMERRFIVQRADQKIDVLSHIQFDHSLQPYNEKYFNSLTKYYSFNSHFKAPSDVERSTQKNITQPKQLVLTVEQFIQAIVDPIAYTYEQCLGATFSSLNRSEDATEPFVINALEKYKLRESILSSSNADAGVNELTQFEQLKLKGHLPYGNIGHTSLSDMTSSKAWVAYENYIHTHDSHAKTDFQIYLKIVEPSTHLSLTIEGVVPDYFDTGLDHISASKKNLMRQLSFWVKHVLVCAQSPQKAAFRSACFFFEDTQATQFDYYSQEDALDVLQQLSKRVLDAQQGFVAFDAKLSEIYVKAMQKEGTQEAALLKVEAALKPAFSTQSTFHTFTMHEMAFPVGIQYDALFYQHALEIFEPYEKNKVSGERK